MINGSVIFDDDLPDVNMTGTKERMFLPQNGTQINGTSAGVNVTGPPIHHTEMSFDLTLVPHADQCMGRPSHMEA